MRKNKLRKDKKKVEVIQKFFRTIYDAKIPKEAVPACCRVINGMVYCGSRYCRLKNKCGFI